MNRYSASTLLVVSFLVLVSCSSGTTPAGVAETFYRYMSQGEVSKAFNLFTKGVQDMANQFGGVAVLADKSKGITKKGGVKEIRILKEEIKGETAQVEVEITYGNGRKEVRKESLVKENGEWKMTGNK